MEPVPESNVDDKNDRVYPALFSVSVGAPQMFTGGPE